jgi:hypothetical protein
VDRRPIHGESEFGNWNNIQRSRAARFNKAPFEQLRRMTMAKKTGKKKTAKKGGKKKASKKK